MNYRGVTICVTFLLRFYVYNKSMKMKKMLVSITSICMGFNAIISVTAEDNLEKQIDIQKKTIEDIEEERTTFGNEITSFDFIKKHSENDEEALTYLAENQLTSLDPTNDISLTDLQDVIQYIIDVNQLREENSLLPLQISDVEMLEVTTSNSVLTYVETYEQAKAGLSNELLSPTIDSIGITKSISESSYVMILDSGYGKYDATTYLEQLNQFIQDYITDYQDALDKLDTLQQEYDEENSVAIVEDDNLSQPLVSSVPTQLMYRLYNPNSGEHFYTSSQTEKNHLSDVGWVFEGNGWVAPTTSNTPVYRVYNPAAGEHHYTMSAYERDELVKVGWIDEGIGWYSDDAKTTPLYRQYNPNQFACNHNYTLSVTERDHLISLGWKDEGIGWYAVSDTPYLEGIDISEHNGDIDLSLYKNGFVIIRAGWGDAVTDNKFERNVALCEEYNIPYGIYLYSYALNEKEALSEADFFITLIQKCSPTVGVWLDIEGDSYKDKYAPHYASEIASSVSQTFMKRVKDAGYHVGIYASQSWFDSYLTGIDEYDKWIARWGENDGTFTEWKQTGAAIHQYTSAYVDPSTGHNLDLDMMYADLSTFNE